VVQRGSGGSVTPGPQRTPHRLPVAKHSDSGRSTSPGVCEPGSSRDDIEARQREWGDQAAPWRQKRRRTAVASPRLPGEALGSSRAGWAPIRRAWRRMCNAAGVRPRRRRRGVDRCPLRAGRHRDVLEPSRRRSRLADAAERLVERSSDDVVCSRRQPNDRIDPAESRARSRGA
jgi:hypothetical protein